MGKRISALTDNTSLNDADYFPLVRASGPTTMRATLTTLIAFLSGKINLSNPYKARAYRNGNVTGITDAANVKIQLNAESYDPNNNFDTSSNYRYTVPITGYYMVNASADLYGTGLANGHCAIFINGSIAAQGSFVTVAATEAQSTVSDIIYLTAGQYVELYVYGDVASGTLNVSGYTFNTYLSIALLSV